MITIVIPARNEAANIGEVIRNIKKHVKQKYELFVIDDASTDHTGELARKLGAKVIRHATRYGGMAPSDVKRFKGDFVISIDADMEHHPRYIPQFVRALKKYDCVLGARTYRSRVMERVLESLFDLPSNDFFSGYVGFRGKWIPFIVKHRIRLVWEVQWAIHAVGGKVGEVFVSARRAARPSRFGGSLRGNLKTLSFFFRFRRHIKKIIAGTCH